MGNVITAGELIKVLQQLDPKTKLCNNCHHELEEQIPDDPEDGPLLVCTNIKCPGSY